jgi:hypothetical protein
VLLPRFLLRCCRHASCRGVAAALPPPPCCRAARRCRPAAALLPPLPRCHRRCRAAAAVPVLPPPPPRCCRLRRRAFTSTGKKSDRTHPPRQKKINRACPTLATTWRARALRRNRRWIATDGGRGRGRCRPWWCVFVCVCVSHGRTKTVVLHSRLYKSCTNHKISNKKKIVNTTLCTTMPW